MSVAHFSAADLANVANVIAAYSEDDDSQVLASLAAISAGIGAAYVRHYGREDRFSRASTAATIREAMATASVDLEKARLVSGLLEYNSDPELDGAVARTSLDHIAACMQVVEVRARVAQIEGEMVAVEIAELTPRSRWGRA